MNFLLETLVVQLPEALFFSIFMILTKKLTRHKLLFITSMCVEYVLLMNAFPYNIYSKVLFFVITYCLLRLLYKNKSQIIDIFTLGIASIIVMIISAICSLIFYPNIILVLLSSRLTMIVMLIALRNNLYKIQNLYKKLWNRNDKVKKKMKTTTFRAMNLVIFNVMFYVINFVSIYMFIRR